MAKFLVTFTQRASLEVLVEASCFEEARHSFQQGAYLHQPEVLEVLHREVVRIDPVEEGDEPVEPATVISITSKGKKK